MYNEKLPKIYSYIILASCMLLILTCIVTGKSLAFGFLGSIIITVLILVINGCSIKELLKVTFSGLKEAKMLYVLILLIGAAASVWLASGVVPSLMYYGFEYMKGMNFLFASFIIVSIISIFMGTAVGTISTVGIALLGVGRGFGIPAEILAGVIISGAFIADKLSPVSGLVNLTISTTKIKYKEAAKAMLPTFIPVYTISAAIYYIIGRSFSSADSMKNLSYYQSAIKSGFYISPYIALIPVIILVLSLSGIKTVPTISTGLIFGIVICILFQHMSPGLIIKAVFTGYHGTTGSAELNKILVSGGVKSMIEVVLIVMGAVALTSILENTGIITPIINKITGNIKTRSMLIFKTGLVSTLLTIVTCDQTVGIILPGRVLQGKYRELSMDNSVLARTISDTGTIIAPLMAWNVNALIITPLTGVSAWSYAPYSVLCYIFPLVCIIFSYVFFNLIKHDKSEFAVH